MNKHLVGTGLLALSIGFAWTTACSSSNNNSCTIGKESCACTNGGACDPGLVCLSARCVKLTDGGSTTTQSTTTTGQGGGTTTSTTTVPSTTTADGQGTGGAPTTT